MLCVGFDQGGAPNELLKPKEIVTGESYHLQFFRKFQKKGPYTGHGYTSVILRHDNARKHTSFVARQTITIFNGKIYHIRH